MPFRPYRLFAPRTQLSSGPDSAARTAQNHCAVLASTSLLVHLGATVVDLDEHSITVQNAEGDRYAIPSSCKIWSAGVTASSLGAQLAEQTGAAVDRAGRVLVEDDLTLPDAPNVYIVSDMMSHRGAPGLPNSRYEAVATIRPVELSAILAWVCCGRRTHRLCGRIPEQGFDSDVLAMEHSRHRTRPTRHDGSAGQSPQYPRQELSTGGYQCCDRSTGSPSQLTCRGSRIWAAWT
ncbi:FAD-dependent oxidoreductase [Rhodococcus koreensis]